MNEAVRNAEKEREYLIQKYVSDERYSGIDTQASGINHLAFFADDLDATIDFYTQVVGLKLLRVRPLDGDPKSTMVFFDLGRDEFLAFLRVHNVTQAVKAGIGGVNHFALNINKEQYQGFKSRAEERGIKYKSISHEILDSISAIDPNGVEVELSVWNIAPKDMLQRS
ncbi:MAG: VOC family protein [Xanthomonadales bacterium]|nr:VOC family protein [Xanthomonadales bacterium]